MKTIPEDNTRMSKMTFSSVFPHYVPKVEKKGRTIEELYEVIAWLTGFDKSKAQELINENITFEASFQKAKRPPRCQSAPVIRASLTLHSFNCLYGFLNRTFKTHVTQPFVAIPI